MPTHDLTRSGCVMPVAAAGGRLAIWPLRLLSAILLTRAVPGPVRRLPLLPATRERLIFNRGKKSKACHECQFARWFKHMMVTSGLEATTGSCVLMVCALLFLGFRKA